jgi:hypothetical protein
VKFDTALALEPDVAILHVKIYPQSLKSIVSYAKKKRFDFYQSVF